VIAGRTFIKDLTTRLVIYSFIYREFEIYWKVAWYDTKAMVVKWGSEQAENRLLRIRFAYSKSPGSPFYCLVLGIDIIFTCFIVCSGSASV
jgi:hypothetical protein